MNNLITNLEAATKGSDELDDTIASNILVKVNIIHLEGMRKCDPGIQVYRHPDSSIGAALRYTNSVDAALTLVPEGWYVELRFDTPEAGSDTAATARINYHEKYFYGVAKTPTLALCIATLKARMK